MIQCVSMLGIQKGRQTVSCKKIYRTAKEKRGRLGKAGLEGLGLHRWFKEKLDALQPSMGQGFPRYKPWFIGPLAVTEPSQAILLLHTEQTIVSSEMC